MAAVAVVFLAVCVVAGAMPGAVLQKSIDDAIAAGRSTLSVPSGTYEFGQTSLVIRGARGLAIAAPDVVLDFYPGNGVLVQDVVDAGISGPLAVQYTPPCFTQGTVVAVNANAATLDIAIDAAFPPPTLQYFNSGEIKLQYFSTDANHTRLRQQEGSTRVAIGPKIKEDVYQVHMLYGFGLPGAPAIGTLVTVSPRIGATKYQVPDFYKGQAWTVYNSTRFLTEDVTLYGSGNFAVTEWGGDGEHVYRSNCDGFHSFSTGKGGTIVDSAISWMGDDALNFHNRVGIVLNKSSASFMFIDVGDIPAPDSPPSQPARAFGDLTAGDSLRLFRKVGQYLGDVIVASTTWVTDPAVVAYAQAVAAHLPALVNPAAVGVWSVSVRGAIPDTLAGDVVQFDRRSSFGARVINTTFTDAYDSCARFQASNITIANSTFTRTNSGITVVYDPGWLEGSMGLTNISIVDNMFAAVGFPSITNVQQLVHADPDVRNLVIEGNSFRP